MQVTSKPDLQFRKTECDIGWKMFDENWIKCKICEGTIMCAVVMDEKRG